MLSQKLRRSAALISSPPPVQTLVSLSAQRRLKCCISKPKGKPYFEPNTYLGSSLSQNGTIDFEVNVRIARVSASFGRLHANRWNSEGINLEPKHEGLQSSCAPFTVLHIWNLHGLSGLHKEAEPLSCNLPQKYPQHQVAGQDSRRWSTCSNWPAQH